MAEGIKEKATDFVKMFGAELALEFYHDDFISAIEELFRPHSAESLAQLIKKSGEFKVPDTFIGLMSRYGNILRGYSVEDTAKILFEFLDEIRPDLTKVMNSLGDEAAAWLYRCTEAARDRIVNPERYAEESDKPLMVLVTCDNCGKSFRIFKEDAEQMKACPFCSSTGGEPTTGEEPAPAEEEEE